MTAADLEQRFALALRRALDGAQPGAPVVHVDAPNVTVTPTFTPTIKATLPALPQPLEVLDVARNSNAFEYEMRVVRDAAGLIVTARMVPVARIEFGEPL
jgi:hypothetical protein